MDAAVAITWQMWVVLALVGAAVVLYCLEELPIELTAAGSIAVVLFLFQIWPLPEGSPSFGAEEILSGFANPALLTIMALLVIGQGVFQTGALESPTRTLMDWSSQRPKAALALVLASVFAVSAFLNNTPVVVMFLPILVALSQRMRIAPSRVLMPLSFVCIFGGTLTMIGTSTNLLVADALRRVDGVELGFFAPLEFGLILSAAGVLYLATIGARLLPSRGTLEDTLAGGEGRQFIAQIEITPGHPLAGAKPIAGLFPELADMTVRLIQRGERAILPPFDDLTLAAGDVVVVAASRAKLTKLIAAHAAFLRSQFDAAAEAGASDIDARRGLAMVEAVVAPGARIIGRTLAQIGFRAQTGCIVLGVQRRSRMIRAHMGEIRLEAGDVLLLMGASDALRALRAQRDVLPLEWSKIDLPDLSRAGRARLVFAAVILTAATGLLPIAHAAIAGAVAMIALQCLNVRQAGRALDLKIYLLIGSAFALGGAMEATGAADFAAKLVVDVFAPFGPAALLSAMFLLVAILTNLMSNNAVAVLFTPIAVATARQLGVDPTAFALTVVFAANCSFATPIGYQTNLLIMGPGHYKFVDFVRVGGPLVLLIWVVFTLLAPWYFDL